MRRDPPLRMLRYLGLALLLALTWAVTTLACAVSARAAAFPSLKPDQNDKAEIVSRDFGVAGRTWGYWGTLLRWDASATPPNWVKWGSYRATCVWLAKSGVAEDKRDNRMVCTVVLTALSGGTLIAQGQLIRPRKDGYLFTRASDCSSVHPPPRTSCVPRPLAITGATSPYKHRIGDAVDLTTADRITISESL
jgi:hypothetical protein